MQDELIRFVPKFIQNRLQADPQIPREYQATVGPAIVLFADISGFTPLSIKLAEMGPEGAEELDRILNQFYGKLVEIIDQQGGDIIAFAGDAAICVWPCENDFVAQALNVFTCGLRIHEQLHDYSVSDGVQLAVRISIASSNVTSANVGGIEQHWLPLVVGEAFDEVGRAANLAERGQVVLGPSVQRAEFADLLVGAALAGGFYRLDRLQKSLEHAIESPNSSLQINPLVEQALRSFVPRIILLRFDAGQSDWLADLRDLTSIFIRLHGLAEDSEQRGKQCQACALLFQQAMERFEGDVVQFLQDDKGVIALLSFGLPPRSQVDDAERAIRSALSIREELAGLGFAADIGISSGRIFSGVRGGKKRVEYSITGHIVNLAARLMSKSAGGIVCDKETQERARNGIAFEKLPELNLKGISHPVPAFSPHLIEKKSTKAQIEVVGRGEELEEIERWRLGDEGRTQFDGALVLEGEAGIGKSVLLAELIRRSQDSDRTIIECDCNAVERATPYFAWRFILPQLIGTDGLEDPALIEAKILDFASSDLELISRASLLNPLLDSSFEEPGTISQLSSEARATMTSELVIELLTEAAKSRPLLLVIDDVQWLDSISWSIFATAQNRVVDLALAFAARPFGETEIAERQQLLQHPSTTRIHLGNLSKDATTTLVKKILQVDQIDEQFAVFLYERTEGNPFFVQEIVHFLSESQLLEIRQSKCYLKRGVDGRQSQTQVPTTMRALITSRVDRLAPAQQVAIKTASIIGRSFARKTLLALYEVEADRREQDVEQLGDHLERISQVRLIQVESVDPDISYLFQHLTVQQVVYDQIPVRNRRSIHNSIAKLYEQSHANNPSFYPLLAYHWGNAQDVKKEVYYLSQAGKEALARFANHEVVADLSLALKRVEELTAEERPGETELGHWHRQLGDAKFHLGDLNASKEHLQKAIELFGHKIATSKIALTLGALGQVVRQVYHRNLPYLALRSGIVDEAEESSGGLQESAMAFQRLSQLHYFQVDVANGFSCALRAMNLTERAGKSPLAARAYSGMCLMTGMVKLHPIANIYAKLARKMSDEIQDLPTKSYVLMATSVYRLGLAQWDQVKEDAQQAIGLAEKIGDQRLLGEAITVDAMRACFLANHQSASEIYQDLYEVARRSENTVQLGWSYSGRGEAEFRRGDLEQSIESFHTAEEYLHSSEHVTEDIRIKGFTAAAHWRLGQREEALRLAREGLAITSGNQLTTVSTLDGIAGFTEVLVAKFREQPEDTRANQEATEAVLCLRRYSGYYPIGKSRWLCFEAQMRQIVGRNYAAKRLWKKSIRLALKDEMLYDAALARLCLASFGQLDRSSRDAQREFASQTFAFLGCQYEMHVCDALD